MISTVRLRVRRVARCALLVVSMAAPLGAQSRTPTPRLWADSALGIAPVWNGLAVTRGGTHTTVANLFFLTPVRLDSAFSGDSARAWATHAFAVRRRAAFFTDAGLLMLAAGALRGALAGRADTPTRALLAGGAASFVVSVPLQFSADAALSRAVWWHNASYSR